MKIFSWIRNKRNGNEGANKPIPESKSYHSMHQSCREEFSDWPNGLLAIGTFGNNNLKQPEKLLNQDNLDGTTAEEFDKELRLLLNKHISVDSGEKHKLSVEELLDYCLSEDERKADESAEKKDGARLERSGSMVERGRRDVLPDKKKEKRGVGRKALSFLIKKALLCNGGFGPSPTLRDPLLDPKSDHSRMEKILRAMLHKKIYPQRPAPKTTAATKYLDMPEIDSDEEEYEDGNHQSKWVKTDSEYIVLEI